MGYDIVKRINQMVAKAKSTDSEAEADSIMRMVRDMLDRHGVSLLSVMSHVEEYDPVEVSREVYGYWQADGWVKTLAEATAAYYDVKLIRSKRGNYYHFHVIGRESCRAAFTAMMPYLRKEVMRLAGVRLAAGAYPTRSAARYRIGTALSFRLWEMADYKHQEREDETGNAALGSRALVPVDLIEAVTRTEFPGLKLSKSHEKWLYNAAIRDAATINLSDQIADEKKQLPAP